MNISQVLNNAYKKLNIAKINSAHLDAELLLSFIIKKTREYILAHPEKKLTKNQIAKFNSLIKQRAKLVPVAYLTHSKEFYGRKFYVNEKVLIPRPETEMIIDEVMRNPISPVGKIGSLQKINIIDIGTGSGCIIITLAKELKNKNKKFFATDISKDALTVARKNSRLHNVDKKIKFLKGNLLDPILKNKKLATSNKMKAELEIRNSSLVICANLPYLTPTQIKKSTSIKHEPKLALTAGKDGLKYYRKLAEQIEKLIQKNPQIKITLICEINPGQVIGMKKIFSSKKIYPANCRRATIFCGVKKDLSGLDRTFIIDL